MSPRRAYSRILLSARFFLHGCRGQGIHSRPTHFDQQTQGKINQGLRHAQLSSKIGPPNKKTLQTIMPFQRLHSQAIIPQIATLSKRIEERFPDRNLGSLCNRFHEVALETQEHLLWIGKPILSVRIAVAALIVSLLGLVIWAMFSLDLGAGQVTLADLIALVDSGVNDLVFISAGIFFLVSLETRIKRNRGLKGLNNLRVLAHVIDMHQLNKDPNRAVDLVSQKNALLGPDTHSSPKRELTAFELTRYLDYCSEMLSLTAKISALYAQEFDDSVVLDTVNEIENLTNALSRKIWQKIMIVHEMVEHDPNVVGKLGNASAS